MPVKFLHLGRGKIKLDPCSLGTSLRNTTNVTLTWPIYNAAKIETCQRYQTCNANKNWKALKWHRVSATLMSWEDARGRESEMPGASYLAQKPCKKNACAVSNWHLQMWFYIRRRFFPLACLTNSRPTMCVTNILSRCFFPCCLLLPSLAYCFGGFRHMRCRWKNEEILWAGWNWC